MTQTDRVLSTPRTNTPIDTTRRRFLTVAAGASVASVGAITVAAAPTTAPAMPPDAGEAADPIFAAIHEYRQVDAACDAVPCGVDIPDELGDRRGDAMRAVMRTCPTTPAGLVALTGWAREQADWLEKMAAGFYRTTFAPTQPRSTMLHGA
jgi:hypothetical protein